MCALQRIRNATVGLVRRSEGYEYGLHTQLFIEVVCNEAEHVELIVGHPGVEANGYRAPGFRQCLRYFRLGRHATLDDVAMSCCLAVETRASIFE